MPNGEASSESPAPIHSSSSYCTASSSKLLASSSLDDLTSSSSSHTLVIEEQSVTNATSSPSSSSSSAEPSESAFDKLLKTSPVNKLPDPKPVFEPIVYDWQEPPEKFRRLIAKSHEKMIKEQLADSGLTEKQIDEYAKSAAHFPGVPSSENMPLELPYLLEPDKISLSSSASGVSPKYFFENSPQEMPSSLGRAATPLWSPEGTRDVNSPERTPGANVFKTPSRSSVEVASLSPIFEKMKMKQSNKCYGRPKMPDSPLLASPLLVSPQLSDGPENLSFSLEQLYGTTNSFSPKATSTTGLYVQATVATQTSLDLQPTKCFSPKATSTTSLEDQDTVVNVVSRVTQTPLYEPTQPIVLLIPEKLSIAEQFAQVFDAEIVVGEWQDRATHVILDFGNKIVNTRAILRKKFLLKLSWLEDSLKEGLLLRPDDYKALLNSDSHVLCRKNVNIHSVVDLFTGYVFLCSKPFDRLSYDLLKELLIYNGATIISRPKEFANHTDKIAICLVGEDRHHENLHMIRLMRAKLEHHCLVKVKYHWVMEILNVGSFRSMKKFLYDTSVKTAESAGIPKNLLT